MIIFAAVFNKKTLDPLLNILDKRFVKFLGTEGTVMYLKKKSFKAESVVSGFDFDGRLKSIDKKVFAGILADRNKKTHLTELKRMKVEPIDIVIVDLYRPKKKNFPESMDIGGQALIRAAIKNYKNVALAFDEKSIKDLVKTIELGTNTITKRRKQAQKAAKFISKRGASETEFFNE